MEQHTAKTALVRCASYEREEVERALEQLLTLTDGLSFVQPGMRVVLKANLVMKKPPEAACTTHPQVLAALTRALVQRGAKVVVGDSPGGPFTERALRGIYRECGLDAVEQAGAALNWDVETESDFFEGGKVLRHIDVARFVKEADAVISVAKLKTHGMMGYTGAAKNLFGVIPGTMKAEYHYRMPNTAAFAAMLVDLAEYVSPALSIIDAVTGMEGDGPSHGDPRFVGGLIASTSPHYADLVGSALMGLTPESVPTLKEAISRGLCPAALFEKDVAGESVSSLAVPDYKTIPPVKPLSSDFVHQKAWLKPFSKVVRGVLEQRPQVDPRLCVGCGECARACPPRAIRIENRLPQIDREKCIRCFCCQELCPRAAMKIHRSRIARLVQK